MMVTCSPVDGRSFFLGLDGLLISILHLVNREMIGREADGLVLINRYIKFLNLLAIFIQSIDGIHWQVFVYWNRHKGWTNLMHRLDHWIGQANVISICR